MNTPSLSPVMRAHRAAHAKLLLAEIGAPAMRAAELNTLFDVESTKKCAHCGARRDMAMVKTSTYFLLRNVGTDRVACWPVWYCSLKCLGRVEYPRYQAENAEWEKALAEAYATSAPAPMKRRRRRSYKFSDETVAYIRQLYAAGEPRQNLMDMYDISEGYLAQVLNGKARA